MNRIITIWMFAVMAVVATAREITVVDADDKGPLAGVSVFSPSGVLTGISGRDGVIPSSISASFPITLRSLGYKPVTLDAMTDTVFMQTSFIDLPEISVDEKTRDIMRQICYVREYVGITSGEDSTTVFTEYMVDYFIPRRKVKKYKFHGLPTQLRRRSYTRYPGDSIVVNDPDADVLSFMNMTSADSTHFSEIKELRDVKAGSDTTMGKWGIGLIARKSDNLYMQTFDALCNSKNHKVSPWLFKMFGLTMDIDELLFTSAFIPNGTGRYWIGDMLFRTVTIHAVARGKWFKKMLNTKHQIDVNAYYEVYPVDMEFMSVDDARIKEKEDRSIDRFVIPALVPPLDPGTAALVARGNEMSAQ